MLRLLLIAQQIEKGGMRGRHDKVYNYVTKSNEPCLIVSWRIREYQNNRVQCWDMVCGVGQIDQAIRYRRVLLGEFGI